ncbi:anion permease [Arcobacter sp. CECT 8986]|uniref:anion permease n=1 Tax=Arcobacter sp. CECT 8986 TaxID=2044507 RepID=UPI001009FB76|nr:anion permease [Arcobacter sp. CECT 8986]RXK01212.1 anion permease [Arcobacter sp. CECT 8986]
MDKKVFLKSLIIVLVGAGIWNLPHSPDVTAQAWHLFAIFAATILGFILQPFPMGVIAFIAITLTASLQVLTAKEALSGFGTTTMWLIVSAFVFAKGFIKTGFGKRIAYNIIKLIGDSTLKLGYAINISDLFISPAMPSSTARAGGVLFPIVNSLAKALKSDPEDRTDSKTSREIGSFLMQVLYQGTTITNAMFLTSMAANPLIAVFAKEILGVEISWGLWALASCVPGIISLVIIPYFIYKVNPPAIKKFPEGKQLAKEALKEMGPITYGEKVVFGVFLFALTMWIFGKSLLGLGTVQVAMLAVSIMVITKVLTWKDVIEEKGAWDTLVWMGTLVTMAGFLSKLGFIKWFATSMGDSVAGIPWLYALGILLIVYVYAHYAFASLTAHITAMYAAFCAVAFAAGAPAFLVAMSFAFMSNICMCITHYGGAPAPIIFGAGYVDQNRWWKIGFFASLINIVVWVGIGSIWWKFIGLW